MQQLTMAATFKRFDPKKIWSVPSSIGKLSSDESSVVRLCYHQRLDYVAVKCVTLLDEAQATKIQNDVIIAQRLCNDRVTRIHGVAFWNSTMGIVTEHFPRGDLERLLSMNEAKIDDVLRLRFASDIAEGLCHLHDYTSYFEYTGHDLTAKGVMLTEDLRCKIAFPGIGDRNNELTQSISAESRTHNHEHRLYAAQRDVLSFGRILQTLFPINHLQTNSSNAQGDDSRLAVIELARECISDNPMTRPTMVDVKVRLLSLLRRQDPRTIHETVGKVLNILPEADLPLISTANWPTLDNFKNAHQQMRDRTNVNMHYDDETVVKRPLGRANRRYGPPYSDQEPKTFSDETTVKEVMSSNSQPPRQHKKLTRTGVDLLERVAPSSPSRHGAIYNDVYAPGERSTTGKNEAPIRSEATASSRGGEARSDNHSPTTTEHSGNEEHCGSPLRQHKRSCTDPLPNPGSQKPVTPPRQRLGISWSAPGRCLQETSANRQPSTSSSRSNWAPFPSPSHTSDQDNHYDCYIRQIHSGFPSNVPPAIPPKIPKSASSPETYSRPPTSVKQTDRVRSSQWMHLLGSRPLNFDPTLERRTKQGGKGNSFKQSIQYIKDKDPRIQIRSDAFHKAYRQAKSACSKGPYHQLAKQIPCMFAQITAPDSAAWDCFIDCAVEEQAKGNQVGPLVFILLASYGFQKLADLNGVAHCVFEVSLLAKSLAEHRQTAMLYNVVLPYMKESRLTINRAEPCNRDVKSYLTMCTELCIARVERLLRDFVSAEATLSSSIADVSTGAENSSVLAFSLLELGEIYACGNLSAGWQQSTVAPNRLRCGEENHVQGREECLAKARMFVKQAVEVFERADDLSAMDRCKYAEVCEDKLKELGGAVGG